MSSSDSSQLLMKSPCTSQPCSLSSSAATAESTPPERATMTREEEVREAAAIGGLYPADVRPAVCGSDQPRRAARSPCSAALAFQTWSNSARYCLAAS